MANDSPFTLTESAYGRVTDETIKRYPALSYLTAKKTAQDAGLDVSNPAVVKGTMGSEAMKKNLGKVLSGKADQRTIERITNLKVDLPSLNAPADQLEQAGYQAKDVAINATTRGRQAVFRQFLDQQQKLEDLSNIDSEIYKKQKRLEYNATEPIDRELAQTRNQMLTARSLMLSKISGLSPSQQNSVLAAQDSFFQQRINDLNAYRKARLESIDASIDEERSTSERQQAAIEARIKGLEKTISFIEDTAGDLDAAADLRIKLAQERKKLKKGSSDRRDTLIRSLVQRYEDESGEPISTAALNSIKMRVDQALEDENSRLQAAKSRPGTMTPIAGGLLAPIESPPIPSDF